MRYFIIFGLAVLLASCATPRQRGAAPHHSVACAVAGPSGEIDAHPLLSPESYTTFRATEFSSCPGGNNILVVSWEGEMTVTNVDLSRNVARRFFSHFHPGESVSFTEIDAGTGTWGVSAVVFQFVAALRDAI